MKPTSLVLGLLVSPIYLASALPTKFQDVQGDFIERMERLAPQLQRIAKENLDRISTNPSHKLKDTEVISWAEKTLEQSLKEMMGKLTIEETNFMQVGFENSLEEFKNIVKTGEKKPFKVGDLLQVKELNTRNDYWDKVRDQLVHSITHPYGCNIGG